MSENLQRKSYRIGRLRYTQEELTWGQDRKLMQIVSKSQNLLLSEEALEFKVQQIERMLLRAGLLERFWHIVLRPRKDAWYFLMRAWWALSGQWRYFSRVDLRPASNTLLREMFTDFFSLNDWLIKKLNAWSNALGLIAEEAMKQVRPNGATTTPKSTSTTKPTPKQTASSGSN